MLSIEHEEKIREEQSLRKWIGDLERSRETRKKQYLDLECQCQTNAEGRMNGVQDNMRGGKGVTEGFSQRNPEGDTG